MSTPDLELQFRAALCIRADEELRTSGLAWLYDHHLEVAAKELELGEAQRDRLVAKLVGQGFLGDEGGYFEAMPLAVQYEEQFDREEFRRRNVLRRDLLQLAARASDAREDLEYSEGEEQFVDRPWLELMAALRYLHFFSWIELREYLGHNFSLEITPEGYDLTQDEAEFVRRLPTTATEDEEAHAAVAVEALRHVIRSVEDMLTSRSWTGARAELARGDQQYAAGHWVDAVSEYYAALESGLKHRLDEDSIVYSAGSSLRDLARLSAENDVIPINYQALFTFLDSVRSPRRHGRGAGPDLVEVGPAEALLMGNHARSLLLYLGHRPS